jgi:hypothetical protein
VFFPAQPTRHTSTDLGAPPSVTLGSGPGRPWYFGGRLTLEEFTVPVVRGDPADLQVGIVTPSGADRWLPSAGHHLVGTGTSRSLRVDLARPVAAGGIVVRTGGRVVTVGIPTAVTAETGGVSLDGQLQYGVRAPHWVFAGTVGSFGVFHNRSAQGWAWTRSPSGGPAPGSTVLARQPGQGGGQQITIHTTEPAELVRSASWTTGWHASVRAMRGTGPSRSYGPPRAVPVLRSGVVQAVALPGPGTYLVTFRYRPTSAVVGMAVSALTGLGLVAWGTAEAVGWLRRRRRSEEPADDEPGVAPDRVGPPQPGGSSPMARADRA